MTHKGKPDQKLGGSQVTGEIMNDSLGTIDPADAADTDPEDEPEIDSDPSSGIDD